MGACWVRVGFVLDACWVCVGFVLVSCWVCVGFVLVLCWVRVGLSSHNPNLCTCLGVSRSQCVAQGNSLSLRGGLGLQQSTTCWWYSVQARLMCSMIRTIAACDDGEKHQEGSALAIHGCRLRKY